jgi:hypothetical protein
VAFEQPALVDVARELVDAGAELSRVSKRSIQSTCSLSVWRNLATQPLAWGS